MNRWSSWGESSLNSTCRTFMGSPCSVRGRADGGTPGCPIMPRPGKRGNRRRHRATTSARRSGEVRTGGLEGELDGHDAAEQGVLGEAGPPGTVDESVQRLGPIELGAAQPVEPERSVRRQRVERARVGPRGPREGAPLQQEGAAEDL